jgi:peptidoglycan/xylan/chitin deacetylase (PgdA/CDA1 family)
LTAELVDSRLEIEQHLSAKVDVFCYPNGQPEDYSEGVIRKVEQLGYRSAVTTVVGFNDPVKTDPFRLKRLSLGMDDRVALLRNLTRLY